MSYVFELPDLGEGLPDATIVKWLVKEVQGVLPGGRVGLDAARAMPRLMALIDVAEGVFSYHQKTVSTVFGRFYKTDAYSAFAKTAREVRSVLGESGLSTRCAEAQALSGINYAYFSQELGRAVSGVGMSQAYLQAVC